MQKKTVALFVVLILCTAILVGGIKKSMALYNYTVSSNVVDFGYSRFKNQCCYDDTNNIIFVTFVENVGAGRVVLARSTDKGQNWTEEVVSSSSDEQTEPACCIDSSGNVHVTWTERNGTHYAKHRIRNSDGSWGSTLTIATYGTIIESTQKSRVIPCVDSGGNVYAIYEQYSGAWNILQVAHYSGGAWSSPAGGLLSISSYSQGSVNIFVDGTTIHCVYEDSGGGGGDYRALYASYNGTSWSAPVTLEEDASRKYFPSVAVNSSGDIYVTWVKPWQVRGAIYTGSWSASAQITSEAQPCFSSGIIPIGTDDFRLFYISMSADPSHLGIPNHAYMDYISGSWGSKTTLSTLSGFGSYIGSVPVEDTSTLRLFYRYGGGTDYFVTEEAPIVTPTVSSCSPDHGPAAGGTSVTIGGSGFVAGATVKFGTVADGYVFATGVTVVDANTITCTVPAATGSIEGLVDVVVTNLDSGTGTLTDGWTYGPTISSISPSQGPLCGGLEVTITGTGLQSGLEVTFNGEDADNVTYLDEHTATCEIPEYAGDGLIDVVVTNPDGEYYTSVQGFNYANSTSSVPGTQPPGVSANMYGFSLLLLENAGPGETSVIVDLTSYTHYMVVANFVGGTGKIRVEVSNDGSNFAIRDDVTNDGYLELRGFNYLRVTVLSGIADVGIGLIRRLMWNEGEVRERSHYNMKLLHGIFYPCTNDI